MCVREIPILFDVNMARTATKIIYSRKTQLHGAWTEGGGGAGESGI